MSTKKDLNYYIKLNWSYTLEKQNQDGEEFFIIRVNELPGVCSDGKTIGEAMDSVQDALEATIELYLEQGEPVPEPIQRENFKGNISYRTTKERHFKLAKIAQRRHMSMNKVLDIIFDAGLESIENG